MAQILNFRTPEYRSGQTAGRHEDQSAEVILFPGVRYERLSEESASGRDQRSSHRDVIELADQ